MSSDRFYLEHYENQPDREVLLQDIGTHLRVSGTVFQGMGSTLILMAPSSELFQAVVLLPREANQFSHGPIRNAPLPIVQPSLQEWSEIIRRSDQPEVFVGEEGGIRKVLHRKQRFEISGEVQQKIWVRDGLMCVYCGVSMGNALMTVDHFVPLELGGANDNTNYVTACKKCNKKKGMMHPKDFCQKFGYDYDSIRSYLERVGAATC